MLPHPHLLSAPLALRAIRAIVVCTLALMPLSAAQAAVASGGLSGFRGVSASAPVSVFTPARSIGPVYYPHPGTQTEREAAETLAHYLQKLSGRTWQALPEPGHLNVQGIFVGNTRRAFVEGIAEHPGTGEAALPEDAVRLRFKPGYIVIRGESPQATQAGVYRFLQTYGGVRWYAPGADGEEVPALRTLRLPQSTVRWQPSFRDRQFHIAMLNASLANWVRSNGGSSHFSFNHNLHRIFTHELFQTHPEYWAQINGKRRAPDPKRPGNSIQLDYTNPAVAERIAQAAQKAFAENPAQLTYSISINDSIDFANDEKTLGVLAPQRYWRGHPVHSDLVFGTMNDTARSVGQDFPARYLTTLAYMWAEAPVTFELEPNLFVYLCIDHGQWYDRKRRSSDMELTRQWARSGAGQLGSWEYYMGTGYFIPRVFNSITAESLAFIHRTGYRSLFFENGSNTGFDAPKMWLAIQLAWDIDANPDALLEDFYRGYYGAAAVPMQRFFALSEERWMTQTGRSFWLKYYIDPAQAELFPPETLQQMQALLDAAQEALRKENAPERFARRLKLTQDNFAYLAAASRHYHQYKHLAALPLQTQADHQRFEEELTVFATLREVLQKAPSQQQGDIWQLRPQMLALAPHTRLQLANWQQQTAADGAETPLADPQNDDSHAAREHPSQSQEPQLQQHQPERVTRIFHEDFSQPILVGDIDGVGPEMPTTQMLQRGWNMRWTHHQGAGLRRLSIPAGSDASAATPPPAHFVLELRNQEFLSIYRWVALPEGVRQAGFSIGVRGTVSPGTQVQVLLHWMDEDNKVIPQQNGNFLPPASYDNGTTLTLAGNAPPNAAWVYIGLRVRFQQPGVPLYFDNWQVFAR